MLPERHPPDDPREWLRLARGVALVAHADIPGAPLELLCFHAQQAAEKAIKPEVRESGSLTLYAVTTRYPLPSDPVSQEEIDRALVSADAVLRCAQDQVGARADSGRTAGGNSDAA
jgi:hypothetical protein